jgi:hypothetical protein
MQGAQISAMVDPRAVFTQPGMDGTMLPTDFQFTSSVDWRTCRRLLVVNNV